MISIVAASVKRAVANSCAKMPRGPKFHVARNNIQDSRTDLLPSRGGIKGTEKNAIPLRNYPARTVIMRIVKRTPSFLRFRIIIRLSWPRLQLQTPLRTFQQTNFTAGLLPRDCIDRKIESHGVIERKKFLESLANFGTTGLYSRYNTFVITS